MLSKSRVIAELESRGVDWRSELSKKGVDVSAFPPPAQRLPFAQFVESTVNFKLHEWQSQHLCPVLERCLTERGLRIAIHGPPQYGKSIIVSQRLPAYLLGCDPNHRVGLACYNETRAGEFGEVVKSVLCSPQFQDQFPAVKVKPDAPSGRFSTTQRKDNLDGQPSFAAMGLLSGFTGRGVDTLILDDPYKSADEAKSETINEKVWRFWSETAKVRIDPSANVIVMFHRYHEDDFAGRLLADGFEYLRFPAIADDNEDGSDPTGRMPGELLSPMRSFEFLREIEDKDRHTFLGMFQGVPRAADGDFIKRTDLRIGQVPEMDLMVRYWDLAVSEKETGDWTVGALGGLGPNQTMYLKDIERFRMEWPDVFARIVEVTEREAYECQRRGIRYAVGVDARLSQQGFFQQLMRHRLFSPEGDGLKVQLWPDREKGKKKERASGWVAEARYGRFTMALAPWNDAFISECLAFRGEDTDTDDQVDAVSGLYSLVWSIKGGFKKEDNILAPGTARAFDKLIRSQRGAGKGIFSG